jgi:hypothetical protein
MTESEWLACTDPTAMLGFLRGKVSGRKLRLFAAACCRRAWHHLTDERSRRAVEVAERLADGEATTKERADAARSARYVTARSGGAASWYAAASRYAVAATGYAAEYKAIGAAWNASEAVARHAGQREARPAEEKAQVALLRDIFGNPFRPVPLTPAWRTAEVLPLAQAAYDQRGLPAGTLDPARLAVLADALEEAGCSDAGLLGHLRGPGPHVRGCWAVDLLLGKS